MIGFYNFIMAITDLLLHPMTQALDDLGVDLNASLTIGFGSVQWFDIAFYDVIHIVWVGIVGFIIIRLIYWIIKQFFGMIGGWLR